MQLPRQAIFMAHINSVLLKSWVITVALVSLIIPQRGTAQSALSHYIWQDSGTYQPFSRTSASITGPIQLIAEGGNFNLRFGDKGLLHLTSKGMFYREWSDDLSRGNITAEIFKLDRDPGKLLNENTLCGDTKARYLVMYDEFLLNTHLLNIAVFSSEKLPYDIKSDGLCGTFNYSVDLVESPRGTTATRSMPLTQEQIAPAQGNISGTYDITTYCRQVSNAVGGSYQIENTCRDEERKSKSNISRTSIPLQINDYCRQVGQAVGGSYKIMETCIKEELKARANLN